MNGYKAFWREKRCEVYAQTAYEAQKLAAIEMKVLPKKRHEVTVVLCEKDGETVPHNPAEFDT